MSNVYIKSVEGGENTNPDGTAAIEIDDGTNSEYVQINNLFNGAPTTGDIIYFNGTKWARLTAGAINYVLTAQGAGVAPAWGVVGGSGFKNRIINGDFQVAQRGTSFTAASTFLNSDDLYNLDRWYTLSDGNDIIDITQETTTVPTDQLYAIALDVETINKKFGIAQIIERKNCIDLIGKTVTLSFKAKVSATTKLDNVKCAIIAWSGTADAVTSDIISAWGVEGTNPTLIANATYENTPANLSLTTSYATYSVSAAIDTASTSNIIVFIWSDVTDTTLGDFLYIADVQLEAAASATSFDRRPYPLEFAMCQRHLYGLSYDPNAAAYLFAPYGVRVGTTIIDAMIPFPTPMFSAPTLVQSTPTYNSGLSGNQIAFFNNDTNAFTTISGALTLTIANVGATGCTFRATAGTSFNGTAGDMGNWYFGATAAILLQAEL